MSGKRKYVPTEEHGTDNEDEDDAVELDFKADAVELDFEVDELDGVVHVCVPLSEIDDLQKDDPTDKLLYARCWLMFIAPMIYELRGKFVVWREYTSTWNSSVGYLNRPFQLGEEERLYSFCKGGSDRDTESVAVITLIQWSAEELNKRAASERRRIAEHAVRKYARGVRDMMSQRSRNVKVFFRSNLAQANARKLASKQVQKKTLNATVEANEKKRMKKQRIHYGVTFPTAQSERSHMTESRALHLFDYVTCDAGDKAKLIITNVAPTKEKMMGVILDSHQLVQRELKRLLQNNQLNVKFPEDTIICIDSVVW